MHLRTATVEDTKAIQKLRLKMLEEVAGNLPAELPDAIYAYLDKNLRDGTCICVLLEESGLIIGKAMLCVYDVMPDEVNVTGTCATLFSVYTLPAYRGQGHMEKLLRFLLEKAKQQGIHEVFASAETKAIPLYERIGFTKKSNEMSIRL